MNGLYEVDLLSHHEYSVMIWCSWIPFYQTGFPPFLSIVSKLNQVTVIRLQLWWLFTYKSSINWIFICRFISNLCSVNHLCSAWVFNNLVWGERLRTTVGEFNCSSLSYMHQDLSLILFFWEMFNEFFVFKVTMKQKLR